MQDITVIGFIYIWKDLQENRFYVGSHLGGFDDGYVCSNKWMKAAYTRRPHTFKRRIIWILWSDFCSPDMYKKELYAAEQRWLDLIPDDQLSISNNVLNGSARYYNMKKIAAGGNGHANKGKPKTKPVWNKGLTAETDNRIAAGGRKVSNSLRGKKKSPEHREKLRLAERKKASLTRSYSRKQHLPRWRAIDPDGAIHQITSLDELAKKFGVAPSSLYRNAHRGLPFIRQPLRGWRIEKVGEILLPGSPP